MGSHPVQKKGIDQNAILGAKGGVDGFKFTAVLRSQIGRRPHPGKEDRDVARPQSMHDFGERVTREFRIDPEQHVVRTKLDNDRIGAFRNRPIEPREAARCRVP